jgi:hypothetical protein
MVAVAPIIVIKKCIIDNPNEKTFLANISWKAWTWAFIMFAAGYFAFTWVPMLLRYLGLLPKNSSKNAAAAVAAAQDDIPPSEYNEMADPDAAKPTHNACNDTAENPTPTPDTAQLSVDDGVPTDANFPADDHVPER